MPTKPEQAPTTNGKTPLEKMTDLTRRIVAVQKSELPKPRKKKRKRH
jgi:hypothetical protein